MRIRLFIEPSANEQSKYNYEMFRDINPIRTERIHEIMGNLDRLISEANKAEMADRLVENWRKDNENKN